jgi:hypothetical protein
LIQTVEFDRTAEVIPREGRSTIFAQTLEEMTIDQLKILVNNANIPRKTAVKKNKATMLKALQDYLKAHPEESLRSLQGDDDEVCIFHSIFNI